MLSYSQLKFPQGHVIGVLRPMVEHFNYVSLLLARSIYPHPLQKIHLNKYYVRRFDFMLAFLPHEFIKKDFHVMTIKRKCDADAISSCITSFDSEGTLHES